VLEVRLLARNLGQRRLATGLVELLEAVEAVAAEAEHLARVGDTAQRLRQLEQSELVANDLLILGHLTLLSNLQRGRICQSKSWLVHLTFDDREKILFAHNQQFIAVYLDRL